MHSNYTINSYRSYRFINMTTLITGATGHIGKAIAKTFASNGRSIILNGRNERKLQEIKMEIKNDNNNNNNNNIHIEYIEADITNKDGIQTIVNKINSFNDNRNSNNNNTILSPVNTLINCAGINIDKILLRTNETQIHDIINTNIIANINLSREITKMILKNKDVTNGSIINIGSVISKGNIGQTVYSTSKAALSGLTKSLSKELGSRNIRVNLIEPGFIGNTEMIENINVEEMMKMIPLKRLGTCDDVAELCLFLSDVKKSGYITGQTIQVDGGMIL